MAPGLSPGILGIGASLNLEAGSHFHFRYQHPGAKLLFVTLDRRSVPARSGRPAPNGPTKNGLSNDKIRG
jgi:hypothetical protein